MKLQTQVEFNTNDIKKTIVENLRQYVTKVKTNDDFQNMIQVNVLEEPYLTFPDKQEVKTFMTNLLNKDMSYNESLEKTMTYIGLINEADYYKLDKKTIGNMLYPMVGRIKNLYDYVNKGHDFPVERFDAMIKTMQHIKKQAKKFKSGTKSPENY